MEPRIDPDMKPWEHNNEMKRVQIHANVTERRRYMLQRRLQMDTEEPSSPEEEDKYKAMLMALAKGNKNE
jgi:hypothetical protein